MITKKKTNHAGLSIAMALMIVVIAGCAQSQSSKSDTAEKAAPEEKHDPITLKIQETPFTDEHKQYLQEMVKKKYPYITIEFVKLDGGNNAQMTEKLTSGTLPDILQSNAIQISDALSMDIPEDLTPYVKKANVDLSRFEDYILKQPNFASDGKLYGFPFYTNFSALYYNKDIFDKFGVPYPKDGMTWEDAIELGKKLTRNEGGVQYFGLGLQNADRVAYSLPAFQIDGKTNQGSMSTDAWKTIYNLMDMNFSISGMKQSSDTNFPNFTNLFTKDKNVAMIPGQSFVLRGLKDPADSGFNFDIVQLPSHKSSPNTYEWDNTAVLVISKTSKLKDDAFKVINLMSTDEYQTWITEHGQLTALKKQDIKLKYGAALPFLKGKNIAGIFKSHAPAPQVISKYYAQSQKHMWNAMVDAIYKGKDINSSLRAADENINKDVQTLKK
ncbi:ABC transporter substrate-binding protein [Paenibacillus cremeus]|uniref:Extracellular solute-binding protein n=1 Tax=Paenibacillus cremeus TaxID=2163881 RepID=A0A559KGE5_9BACL|nr:extracellular solute-binding protein [Paenibacillus cremeus]TVY11195.1 extracellular solute-binding protein [Paenibacillus cremeus]